MAVIACTALVAWIGWVTLNFSMILLASFVALPNQPCFTGFRIVIPAWVVVALSAPELAAIIAHEKGHRAHWHAWKNFVAVCLFIPVSAARRLRQEHEADDYAAALGHATALASALVKLSAHRNDVARAERLIRSI